MDEWKRPWRIYFKRQEAKCRLNFINKQYCENFSKDLVINSQQKRVSGFDRA